MPADSAGRSLLSKLLGEVVCYTYLLDERELLLEKVGVPFLNFKDRLHHVRGSVITSLAARGDAGVVIDDRAFLKRLDRSQAAVSRPCQY